MLLLGELFCQKKKKKNDEEKSIKKKGEVKQTMQPLLVNQPLVVFSILTNMIHQDEIECKGTVITFLHVR